MSALPDFAASFRALERIAESEPEGITGEIAAGWRKSTTGWPGPDEALIERMPEWVAEILSPGSRAFDAGPKKEAYGMMGVGWLWLVDTDARRIEVHENVRGKMIPTATVEAGPVVPPPFGDVGVELTSLFWS